MNLLVVNWQDRMNPQAGGAEVHVHEVFGRLAAAGHQVTLLASGWPGAAPVEHIDGIEVHRIGGRYSFPAHAPGYYRRRLADRPFDGVVEALNKVPVFAPLWVGRPVVLLVHHLFGTTAFREASPALAAATWLLERPLATVYAKLPVQAISESTAADLAGRGLNPDRITVIHPGVDVQFFTPGARAPSPEFLYLGRLQRYKQIDLILRAFAQLRDNGIGARLTIAGRGPHEPALRELAEQVGVADRVRFAGLVDEATKRALFRASWANVFASPKEGWGITNVEAAACGTPTVASDSPGLRESVRDGQTGLLVPHGDVGALAAAIASLAESPARVEQLGRAAREFAEGLTWDRAAAATETHLETSFRTQRKAVTCSH